MASALDKTSKDSLLAAKKYEQKLRAVYDEGAMLMGRLIAEHSRVEAYLAATKATMQLLEAEQKRQAEALGKMEAQRLKAEFQIPEAPSDPSR